MTLDLDTLREVIAGTAAAFRCVTDYQPAGGPGDKVFPPTYEGGKYATEERIDPATGERKPCVLLDSVQSQANRMELALLEAHRAGKVTLPLIVTTFDQPELLKRFTVTSLEAPHRAADALFRDSLLNGVIFRNSDKGRILTQRMYATPLACSASVPRRWCSVCGIPRGRVAAWAPSSRGRWFQRSSDTTRCLG